MKTLLLVDSNFLCHRAARTTGNLSHQGDATGVAFGFLRDIDTLRTLFNPDTMIFAFDYGGKGHRGVLYPEYKANRKSDWDEETYEAFIEQVKKLHSSILPTLGYKNIFRAKGYEADDIIARVSGGLYPNERAIIISADKDLYQCLRRDVSMYNPITKDIMTIDLFVDKYGIDPAEWANVKALAGCPSDNIKGVEGIGEKTAVKWYTGGITPESRIHNLIIDNYDIVTKNLPLVKLPFEQKLDNIEPLIVPTIREDEYTDAKRMDVNVELGIRYDRRKRNAKKEQVGFF